MTINQYIIMPASGFSGDFGNATKLSQVGSRFSVRHHADADVRDAVHVLASISADGPKLVEMTPEAELGLRLAAPDLAIVPVRRYELPDPFRAFATSSAPKLATVEAIAVRVVDRKSGRVIAGARIVAFTNYRHRIGAEVETAADGVARLHLAADTRIERLYVFPVSGFWGLLRTSVAAGSLGELSLLPLGAAPSCRLLEGFSAGIPEAAGKDVRVAIIDSGVDRNHPDLRVEGGANTVSSELIEDPALGDDWGPARIGGHHGTHVAGIVARRAGNGGSRGVAPGAIIRSYRVFPHDGGLATSFDILDAIDRAVRDECRIINLSLGMDQHDPALEAGVRHAQDKGVLVVAAAGNDGMRPVSFPAAYSDVVAVTAMGDRDLLPPDSPDLADASPVRNDRGEFFAAFSNKGPRAKLIGPGVGVISTVPGGFAVMGGTSMAAPAIAGFAAALLSEHKTLRNAPVHDRATRLTKALYASAVPLGFGRDYEGFGLPRFDRAEQAVQFAFSNDEPLFES